MSVSERARLAATVMQGEDGFLFHRDHEAVEQLTGQLPLTPGEVTAWTGALEARSRWARACGVVFRALIVPEKHIVMGDKLPGFVPSPDRPVHQILRALEPAVLGEVIYPAEMLAAARAGCLPYFRTDTHWTEMGGFLAYQALLESLPPGFIEQPITGAELGVRERPFFGDLAARLDPEPGETALTLFHTTPRPFALRFHNHGASRGSTVVYEGDPAGKRAVIFRDSFFNYCLPHLIPVLSRTVAVSSLHFHYDLLASERPDLVVVEVAERLVGSLDGLGARCLPDDHGQQSFEALSGVSLQTLKASTAEMASVTA